MTRLCPRLLLLANVRTLRRHWFRTGLILLSTALGVAAIVGTFAVNDQVLGAFAAVRGRLTSEAPLAVDGRTNGVPLALAARLQALPGVDDAVPVVAATVLLRDGTGSLLLVGVDPRHRARLLRRTGHDLRMSIDPRVVLASRSWVLIDRAWAGGRGLQTGDRLPVLTADGGQELSVAGVFDSGPLGEVLGGQIGITSLGVAQSVKGLEGACDRIDLFLRDGVRPAEVLEAAAAAVGPGAEVRRSDSPVAGAEQAFAQMGPGLMLAALTAVLAGAFLVHNVHALSLAERRPEIGTARALGATRRQVLFPLLGEGLVLGSAGSALGIPLGWAVAAVAVRAVRDNLPLLGTPGRPEVHLPAPHLLVLAAGVGLLATLLAVLLLALPAAREVPALSMRRRLEPRAAPLGLAARLLGGAFVIALLVLGWVPAGGEGGGYAAIGSLGLAFGLLGPVLARAALRPILALGPRRLLWRLAIQNLLRYPRRVGLTVAAVGLASALGLQSAAVVASFRGEIVSWVDGSITGDLYLTSGASRLGVGRSQPLGAAFLGELRAVPGVRSARGARGIFVNVGSEFVYLVGVDMEALESGGTMRWHEGSWAVAAPAVLAGRGVLVSDNFAALHGVHAGDRLTLPGQDGPYTVEVSGIITDYSWGRGTILADRALLVEKHRTPTMDIVVLFVQSGVAIDAVRAAILERYGATYDLRVAGAAGFRAMVLGELSSAFSVAGAQQAVVLVLAFLAVLNTVTLSLMARRTETRFLGAVGATPGQIRGLAVAEGATLAVLGTVLGLVLGAVITAILMRDLLFAASGWRLPVTLPWPLIGGLVLGSAALGALAGLLGARLAKGSGESRRVEG